MWYYWLTTVVVLLALAFRWLHRAASRVQCVDPEVLRSLRVPQDTLFAILQTHALTWEVLRARGYASGLEAVQICLGVVPTCDLLLEIWPPAFHAYNAIVPNFLNLPELILGLGTRPSSVVTLAGYASSRASGCAYCAAHMCAFSLRRGVPAAKLSSMRAGGESAQLSAAERAAAAVGWALGRVPCELTRQQEEALRAAVPPEDVEWVVACVAMFGAFNKLMDGLGVPLEPSTVADTKEVMGPGWTPGKASQMLTGAQPAPLPPEVDDWRTKLKLIWLGLKPGGLLSTDARLLRGVPATPGEASELLLRTAGCDFPVLAHLTQPRLIRAVTCVVGLNFDDANSAGLAGSRKALAAAVAAQTMGDRHLVEEMRAVGAKFGAGPEPFQAALRGLSSADHLTAAALRAAEALAHSPARVTQELVAELRGSGLSAAMLVELVSVVACTQMLHRLERFFLFDEAA